ncbi:MAG TPA: Ldh family oxidoreductase [Burkholderiaceae bacterium]|nr:Ldh family oxidoreductase [Burkholderiaceae bacterium]
MATVNHIALSRNVVALLEAAGVDPDKAEVVSDVLLDADLMGHNTHGVALLDSYLDALATGRMRGSGDIKVVSDRGSCVTWDGQRLPGGWLVKKAMALGYERLKQHGVVTFAIGNSHHIGALAVYLRDAAEKGYIAQIKCSTASAARMAPFGGIRPVLTPNPLAEGYPTDGDPVMIDISSSITTTSMTQRLAREGRRYPGQWALTAEGEPTDDPGAVTEGGGTLLPLGGSLKGHKGYGLALGVDLMTQGLAGFGRVDHPDHMALAVFVQLIDPEAFSGLDAFLRQSNHTTRLCRATPAMPGVDTVRVPGDAAARKRRTALEKGLDIPDALLERLERRARETGAVWQSVDMPV